VRRFWHEAVTEKDKSRYLDVLKREKYDVSNEEQMMNEFFAYTLEEGRPQIFASSLIKRYRDDLKGYITAAAGALPALVELSDFKEK
jgi:hypothetical protein